MTDQIVGEEREGDQALTKAERKQLRRAEKEQAREREARRKKIKRRLVWGAVLVGVGLFVWLVFNGGGEEPLAVGGRVEGVQLREGDWVKGNRLAGVVLVEYADFQCPACASYSELVRRLNSTWGDQVAFVYRHFPLRQIHNNADLAAYTAEAAGRQGKFWEMHDILYERQADWSDSGEAKEIFTEYGRELGLDLERWLADVEAQDIKDKIDGAYGDALSLGLRATPSFFLNGKKIEAGSYEQFEQLISRELGEET